MLILHLWNSFLYAEILAARMNIYIYIKSIKTDYVEFKLSQNIDDTSTFSDGSRTSLKETLTALTEIQTLSD